MTASTKWYITREFEAWSEFKAFVSDDILDGHCEGVMCKDLVFRGQGNANWPLTASLDRILSHVATQVRQQIHETMLSSFRTRAKGESPLPGNDAEVLALMQHYGAPTRLLDWSGSPYVAAFFAFSSTRWAQGQSNVEEDEEDEANCAIFALRRDSPALSAGAGVETVATDLLNNPRAYHQQGSFTVNRSLQSSLEEYFKLYFTNANVPEPTLWKYELPRREASIALRDLELMGITSESLFLGWEGSARYAFFRAMDAANLLQ
ncbi:FRG domain-containing protein [Blastococcus capsensis]|uniref:FRG domain-containing protein n=1 Tax=Blastococcus capsensis TaxID=1564163 RepID=UPI002541021A|nr:FRG domain-containing protein [Blastococcus capsensis]MDK3258180.1 FRG domain-containing protein [Blastococcus capsensis]